MGRCLLVTGSLDVGGMDAFVAFLAQQLRRDGWTIGILVTEAASSPRNGRLAAELRSEGLTVMAHGQKDGPSAIAAWQPDVCSIHGAEDWAVVAAAALSIPAVETLHGMHNLFSLTPSASWDRFQHIETVVGVSELVRDQFVRRCPQFPVNRTVTIPNGVESRRPDPALRARAREHLGLTDEFLVLSLARHCLQKNTYGLVRGFLDVVDRVPDAHLLVAGRPDDLPYATQVRSLVDRSSTGRNVHLRDHVTDATPLLAAADCFVMDSFFEGWSLATTEALTVGLPVIMSDVGGAREQLALVPHSGVLLSNPSGDPLDLDWARMAAMRYRDQPNRNELVGAIRDVAARRADWIARRLAIAELASAAFDPRRCAQAHGRTLVDAAARHLRHW